MTKNTRSDVIVSQFMSLDKIGKEVAVSELANALQIGQKTVERYLEILEKMFVLVNIRGFSRNLRKEVIKTSRYYFADIHLFQRQISLPLQKAFTIST